MDLNFLKNELHSNFKQLIINKNHNDVEENITMNMNLNIGIPNNNMYYNMHHKDKGLALIFNHEHFDIDNLNKRTGTNVDCKNLKMILKKIHFKVAVFNDLCYDELKSHIIEAAKHDHVNSDCILICVLSHGEMGKLYAKDKLYKSEILWESFTEEKCPSLSGKPKLFFIQACQGDNTDEGIMLNNRTEFDGRDGFNFPMHPDFLMSYSTIPGYCSWRNTKRGSWFIEILTKELRDHGKEKDILSLLTAVSQRVAYDYESYSPDIPSFHKQKQIPCIVSTLTKLLILSKRK